MRPTHKRNDVVFLDKDNKFPAEEIQAYMNCRDGIVIMSQFRDISGYGCLHKAFYCNDCKSEYSSLVIYRYSDTDKSWSLKDSNTLNFDNDSWDIIKGLINGECTSVVRDYNC